MLCLLGSGESRSERCGFPCRLRLGIHSGCQDKTRYPAILHQSPHAAAGKGQQRVDGVEGVVCDILGRQIHSVRAAATIGAKLGALAIV